MGRDELIGRVIADRFEIRERIGKGGMGAVYRAWQRSVKRDVAIKVIAAAHSRDAGAVKRFEREARLASQLSQPNIVSVFDFGRTGDGQLYIAMELIRGRNLFEALAADGTFALERVVRIGTQVCDALEAAHGQGIIHRDLKHENVIMLDEPPGRDLVKVLDFGLARLVGEESSSDHAAGIGTPRFLAPEVITESSQPASDVYALGVMLAELVIGEPLWDSDDVHALMPLKREPASALAKVPEPFSHTIGALIDPEPGRRPSAAQARALLRQLADGSFVFPPLVRPKRVRSGRSLRAIAVAIGVALAIAAVVYGLTAFFAAL